MNVITAIANLKPVQRTVTRLAKNTTRVSYENGIRQSREICNLQIFKKHFPAIFGGWFGLFYGINIYNSKGIPKERKNPLFLNIIINTILGVLGGYLFTSAIKKYSDRLLDKCDIVLANHPEKELIKNGLKSVAPQLGFIFAFRLVAPVIATYLAGKANKFLGKHKKTDS